MCVLPQRAMSSARVAANGSVDFNKYLKPGALGRLQQNNIDLGLITPTASVSTEIGTYRDVVVDDHKLIQNDVVITRSSLRAVSGGIISFIVVVVVVVLVKHRVTIHCISRAKRKLRLICWADSLKWRVEQSYLLHCCRAFSRFEIQKGLRGAHASATCTVATGRGT